MENDTQLRVDLQSGIVLTTEEYTDLQCRASSGTSPASQNVPFPPQRSHMYSPRPSPDRSANQLPMPNTHTPGMPTSKSASPVQPGTGAELTGEPLELINELINELNLANTPDTAAQIDLLHAIRGAFTTGCQHLLATTAAAIDQRSAASDTHAVLVKLWDETIQKLYDLHNDISTQHAHLDKCIEASIFALRGLGITEDTLGTLAASAFAVKRTAPTKSTSYKSTRFEEPARPSRDDPSQLFNASFASGLGVSQSGYTTAVDPDTNVATNVFEEFSLEADHQIRAIVERELREETDFFGGPSIAPYHIVVLKTLIEGPALEWFVDYVESRPGHVSETQYDFASILCALHHRFITAATAQQASRNFDAVRYSPEDGPLKLMDTLMSASRRMREPMTQFMIAQRFLELLPDKIYDMMLQHRGLSAEYSSLAQLCTNVHQIWSTDPMTRSTSRGHAVQNQTPRRVVAPIARLGVSAQRVPDTYEEDKFPDEDDEPALEEQPYEGSQYDPDVDVGDRDPNEAPDLGDLIEAQYFSLRVMPLVPLDPREAHPVIRTMSSLSPIQRELAATFTEDWHLEVIHLRDDLYSSSAQLDLERLEDHCRHTGLAEFSEDERASRLCELVMGHEYCFAGETMFAELAQAYQICYSEHVGSRVATEEWNVTLLLSVASLGRSSEILVEQTAHFSEVLSTNREVRDEVIHCTDAARESIEEIDSLPLPARAAIGQILDRAREMLITVEDEMGELVGMINREEPRLKPLHSAVADELGRRYEEGNERTEGEGPERGPSSHLGPEDSNSEAAADSAAPRAPTPAFPVPAEDQDAGAAVDSTAPQAPHHAPCTPTDTPTTVIILGIEHPLVDHFSEPPTPSSVGSLIIVGIVLGPASSTSAPLSEYPRDGDTPPPEYFLAGTPASVINSAHDDAKLWGEVEGVDEEMLNHAALRPPTPPPPPTFESLVDNRGKADILVTTDASLTSIGIDLIVPGDGSTTGRSNGQAEESAPEDPSEAMPRSFTASISLRMFWAPDETGGYVDPTFGDIWDDAHQAELARLREDYSPDEIEWMRGPSYSNENGPVEDPGPEYGEPYFQAQHSPRSSSDSGSEPDHGDQVEMVEIDGPAEPRNGDECILKTFAAKPYWTLDTDHIEELYTWTPRHEDAEVRTWHGFRDTSPRLFPGNVVHKRLASLGPENDDEDVLPGSRVRFMNQHVEHITNVNQLRTAPQVGITDQPTCLAKDLACLTAELEIGGMKAFMLFDSGSNTDSLTSEFARATNCWIFKLNEQITLQLGCVGSRSRINYGARAPVNFGSIKGHAYYDLVNLDRYDGIIGTPFMIKHSLILDFGKREVRLPSGKIISTLSIGDEAKLVHQREGAPHIHNCPAPPSGEYQTRAEMLSTSNVCLPDGYPFILELESDYVSRTTPSFGPDVSPELGLNSEREGDPLEDRPDQFLGRLGPRITLRS
ncbi:hypothetical protein DFH07DRAFT_780023 [Mycena maculata]|uniref:Uncharacterized protein n=1 Tax=Mycena maculata TaxID=230809 RepID=A0AAD7MWL4_9AGAR|nr:hypothetical protein DFH07DRAFT_780023 [Mycena maculata]